MLPSPGALGPDKNGCFERAMLSASVHSGAPLCSRASAASVVVESDMSRF